MSLLSRNLLNIHVYAKLHSVDRTWLLIAGWFRYFR